MNGHSVSGADCFCAAACAAGAGLLLRHGASGTFSTNVWPQPQTSQSGNSSSARDRSPIPYPWASLSLGSLAGARGCRFPHPIFIGRPPAATRAFSTARTPPLLCAGGPQTMMPDILGQSSERTWPNLRNWLPVSYARQTVEIAAERGIAPERILAGTGITLAMLQLPELRLAASAAARIVRNALDLTGDRGLGLELGFRA